MSSANIGANLYIGLYDLIWSLCMDNWQTKDTAWWDRANMTPLWLVSFDFCYQPPIFCLTTTYELVLVDASHSQTSSSWQSRAYLSPFLSCVSTQELLSFWIRYLITKSHSDWWGPCLRQERAVALLFLHIGYLVMFEFKVFYSTRLEDGYKIWWSELMR